MTTSAAAGFGEPTFGACRSAFRLACVCAVGCASDGGGAGGSTCGDGVVQAGEMCDDGAENSDTLADACRPSCESAACGDGAVDSGEGCDDGEDNSDTQADACREACVPAACGDGIADTGEDCDDGNASDGDNCRNDCSSPMLWARTIQGPIASGIAVDGAGHILLVGSVYGPGGTIDVWMARLDPDGQTIWEVLYDGEAGGEDQGVGAAVDGQGNLWAAGRTTSVSGDQDVWVGKVDPSGGLIWTRTYAGASGGDDFGREVAVDARDDTGVVVGMETGAGDDTDVWVRKYDGMGNEVWSRTYDGVAGGNDYGQGVAVDADGNVLVAGMEDWDGAGVAWVRKYDPDGATLWSRTYAGATGAFGAATGVAVDARGNVVVTGYEYTTTTDWDAFVRKYDADGGATWTRTHDGAAHGSNGAADVVCDAAGDVSVTGEEVAAVDLGSDVWTAKYTPDGTLAWSRTHNGIADQDDSGWGVATDSAGDVLVVGSEGDAVSGYDFLWLAKYLP